MTNKITTKWEKTGLLEGLDNFNKTECAVSLETAMLYLINEFNECSTEVDKIYNHKGHFAGTILPIIRLLYSEPSTVSDKMPTVNIHELINNYYKYCLLNLQFFKDLNDGNALDGESEFCSAYIDRFKTSFIPYEDNG